MMFKLKVYSSILAVAFSLVACGGGSDSGNAKSPVASVAAPSIEATSYLNMKKVRADQIKFTTAGISAWALGDFLQDKTASVFFAEPPSSLGSTTKSEFVISKLDTAGNLSRVQSFAGCQHPRKAVTADFNHDGLPDIFVACHGADVAPYPGAVSKLLMSGSGGLQIKDFSAQAASFTHGAAAADIDGDGWADLALVNGTNKISFFQNRGGNSWTPMTVTVDNLQDVSTIYSIEIVDVDGDGWLDILVGGHDSAKILFGNSAHEFGQRFLQIPTVSGRAVVLDFTVITSGTTRYLWVNRTSDSSSSLGFYHSRTLQTVNLTTGRGTVAIDIDSGDTWNPNTQWTPWLLPNRDDSVSPFDMPSQMYRLNR